MEDFNLKLLANFRVEIILFIEEILLMKEILNNKIYFKDKIYNNKIRNYVEI
jgi:hypothetical protein